MTRRAFSCKAMLREYWRGTDLGQPVFGAKVDLFLGLSTSVLERGTVRLRAVEPTMLTVIRVHGLVRKLRGVAFMAGSCWGLWRKRMAAPHLVHV